jgi:Zn-dependent protease with chaperone function
MTGILRRAAPALGVFAFLALAASAALAQGAFDPDAATRAYLDSVPADLSARSDAYFEGGYWLQLWDLLYALVVAFVLMRFGLSVKFRNWAEKVTKRTFVHSYIYAVFYVAAGFVLSLPLTIYESFIREHQYGLANQTLGPWFVERLIGLGVNVVLFGLLIAAIYAVIRKAPRAWPLIGGGVVAVFLTIGVAIAPVFIAPLFNDYQALEPGPVKTAVLEITKANGVPADDVYWFDASKQTDRISANVSGFLGTTRISLNDNLLNQTTIPEIKAVVAHETGHYVTNLVIALIVPLALLATAGFYFAQAYFPKVMARFGKGWGVRGIDDFAGAPVLAALLTVFFFVTTPVTNTIIRENERLADIFGLNASREPDAFATVALKLASYRKLEPSALEEFVFYDHPSGKSRISMAMHWKAENLTEDEETQ